MEVVKSNAVYLPPELWDRIISYVGDMPPLRNRPSLLALCMTNATFFSLAHRHLYRKIFLRKPSAFLKLCIVLCHKPRLAAYVRSLAVVFCLGYGRSLVTGCSRLVLRALGQMRNLQQLSLCHDRGVKLVLPFPKTIPTAFPGLWKLHGNMEVTAALVPGRPVVHLALSTPLESDVESLKRLVEIVPCLALSTGPLLSLVLYGPYLNAEVVEGIAEHAAHLTELSSTILFHDGSDVIACFESALDSGAMRKMQYLKYFDVRTSWFWGLEIQEFYDSFVSRLGDACPSLEDVRLEGSFESNDTNMNALVQYSRDGAVDGGAHGWRNETTISDKPW